MEYIIITLLAINLVVLAFVFYRISLMEKQRNGEKVLSQMEALQKEVHLLKKGIENYEVFIRRERMVEAAKTAIPPASEAKKEKTFIRSEHEQVFELHEQGFSKEAIAKKLEKGCGEVELILQLAQQARGKGMLR